MQQSAQNPGNTELVASIVDGDKEAFRSFITAYQRLVGHIVCRMVKNYADREDLCQDIFVKIYRSLPTFRFHCKVSTWVAKIAYNSCVNYLHKCKIPLYDDCTHEYESLHEVAEEQLPLDAVIEGEEVNSLIRAEILTLNAQYRTILTLYHLDGMSYAEIGEIMDLPEGTVKSYLHRARRQLKERLMSKYCQEELCQIT